jgi:hypothetical protein
VTCGEHSELKVEQGNKVNYCVTLFNGGEVVLQTHRIVIPGLNIDQQFDHLLAPGAFVRVTAADIPLLGGVTIAATQTQTLTVYSTNPPANPIDAPQYLVAPELFTAESSAEAVVQLLENGVEPEAQTWLYLPNIAR